MRRVIATVITNTTVMVMMYIHVLFIYEIYNLLGYDAMSADRSSLKFKRNILPSFSRPKSKPNKEVYFHPSFLILLKSCNKCRLLF
jgi:hypothetical protein